MKSQLNSLLREQGIDVLWVSGATASSPQLSYLTDGAQFTSAWVIVRPDPDKEPILCYPTMERESARSVEGMQRIDFSELGAEELAGKFNDPVEVELAMFERLAERENLAGKLAVHGMADMGESFDLLTRLAQRIPQLELIRDLPPVLRSARAAKDTGEIKRMRDVAARALEAMKAAIGLIRTSHAGKDGVVSREGGPVTVGDIRAALSRVLGEQGLSEPYEAIISIGPETAVPHASSPDDTVLYVGRPVVIDLFPCMKGGGFYFDITRSFCIGEACDEYLELYSHVLEAQEKALEAAEAGMDGSRLHELVCGFFESLGHPTKRSHPGTLEGYVHSLGHGVGLEVHEYPFLRLTDKPDPINRLEKGSVFTIEPGLYYPGREMGIRLEDVVFINPKGKVEILAPYEKFPVIETC